MEGNDSKTLIGTLREVIYRRRNFVRGILDAAEGQFVITPNRIILPNGGDILTGQRYKFHGRLKIHKRYGIQFVAESHSPVTAEPKKTDTTPKRPLLEALVAGEVPSIGAATGKRLVVGFGEGLYTLKDATLLTVMDGVGERKANIILANIHRYLDGSNR